jgi:hypothetical protein
MVTELETLGGGKKLNGTLAMLKAYQRTTYVAQASHVQTNSWYEGILYIEYPQLID